MAGIQLVSAGGAVIAGGEEALSPLQVALMPSGGNSYRYAGFTGTIAAALAANSELLQFRFVSGTKTYAIIEKIVLDGMGLVAVATAAGPVGFNCYVARVWTAAGSGGTRIAMTADNLQMETAEPNSQVLDLGIATTGALTAGTKTLDANAIGQVIGGVGTAPITAYGAGSLTSPQPFLDSSTGNSPLILANQEGFVIRTTHAGPAAFTYSVGFTVVWREVTAF
ncbi:hypothetical protein UFOVP1469_34 [uncultured Caudovirales phage]|uniref:Uncharacterized protein n=1 Tax=uncultured Caudovirales phage TaxID=2100421 RepID=A0A6J5SM49_9CAUD|nr:hypothetical protein UFOVP1469_34 [uncultured Caudovirales phage]CAB5229241.1 hypothetical protein UFOVP1556_18 [uncultured Caudovirales phage]